MAGSGGGERGAAVLTGLWRTVCREMGRNGEG